MTRYPDVLDGGFRNQWNPNDAAWFEYHCYENHDSSDAVVWYRSHQAVTVLAETAGYGQRDIFPTFDQRSSEGEPVSYRVQFRDGFEYEVWEDELVSDPEYFYRPTPPPASRAESGS